MKIKKYEIESLLKKVPTGYYFGKCIPIDLSESAETSYCSLDGPKIVISYNNLVNLADKINDVEDGEYTMLVRSLVFHEISHALLTPYFYVRILEDPASFFSDSREVAIPKELLAYLVNTAEDQRIETITCKIFEGVDYRKLINKLAPLETTNDLDPMTIYFNLIRYNILPSTLFSSIEEPERSQSFRRLFSKRSSIVNSKFSTNETIYSKYFIEETISLYFSIVDAVEHDKENESKSSETSSDTKDLESSSYSETSKSSPQTYVEGYDDRHFLPELGRDEFKDSEETPRLGDLMRKKSENSLSFLSSLMKPLFNPEYSEESNKLVAKLKQILVLVNKSSARQSAASSSYSGVFNPRQADRDDCRFFITNTAQGSQRLNNRIQVNLFIDRSGSFYASVDKVNILLRAMHQLRQICPRFSFTISTIGEGVRNEDVDRYFSHSAYDGTFLDESAFNAFNKVQNSEASCLNVVLIDGYAWATSNDKDSLVFKNVSAFNHKNTVVITDRSNQREFERFAPMAKLKICYDYADMMINEVVTYLKKMLPAI